MTGAINNLAASAAGAPVSSQKGVRDKRKADAEEARRRDDVRDRFDKRVSEVEEIDAIRTAKDATQEESREDREEHSVGYRPDGLKFGQRRGELDLNA